MADVDLTPTAEMARNAARGLELRREHGRGGTEVGVARARDISNGKTLSPETVRRMHAFFSRHAKNKAGGEDDAGYIAWMLWGGDEGRDWASRKVDALDRKERNAMSDTRKAIMERLGMAAGGEKAKLAKVDRARVMRELRALRDNARAERNREAERLASMYLAGLNRANTTEDDWEEADMATSKILEVLHGEFSRPGAKAKFAQSLQDYQRLIGEFNALDKEIGRLIDRAKEMSAKSDRILSLFPKNERDPDAAAIASSRQAMAELRKELNVMLSRFQFSRPGTKAKMDKNAAYIEYANLRETTSKLENRIARAPASDKPRLMAELAKQVQRMKELSQILRASRPGAKAKMGMRDTKGRGPFTLQYIASGLYGEPTWLLVDKANKVVAKEHNEQSAKEMLRKANAGEPVYVSSRPGAKAKMAVHAGTLAMAQANYNRAKRDLDEAQERLDAFLRVGQSEQRIAQAERGVALAEQRFKDAEKALRSLNARPGAKANFGKPQFRVRKLHNGYLAVDVNQGSGWERYDTTHEDSWDGLDDYERGYEKAYARGLRWSGGAWRIPSSQFSRPGAKVRAALADACWEGYEAVGTKPQDGKTVPNCVPKMKAGRAEDLYRKLSGGTITNANVREWDRLVTEALRMPDFTPPGGDMSLHEIAEELGGEIMALKSRAAKAQAAKPAEDDLEREDVKAGLKLMSASDPAVSDKIRTLIKEGKPQDQAVAIALDMKRRGEL